MSAIVGLDFAGKKVLEIGSKNVNGSVRPLFVGADYLGIDVLEGADVDCVIDARDFDGHGLFDYAVSTEALEHCPYPQEIVQCAYRALKSGGLAIITAASTGRVPHKQNGEPGDLGDEWYQNIEADGLKNMLEETGFEQIKVNFRDDSHDVQATAMKP